MKGSRLLCAFVSCVLLFVVTGPSSQAQNLWEPVHGPYTANIFSMGLDGNNNILVGSEHGGVFRSTNGGADWQYLGLAGETVRTLYLHSDGTLYAGLQNGMMSSTDNGSTWELSNFNTGNNAFGISFLPRSMPAARLSSG